MVWYSSPFLRWLNFAASRILIIIRLRLRGNHWKGGHTRASASLGQTINFTVKLEHIYFHNHILSFFLFCRGRCWNFKICVGLCVWRGCYWLPIKGRGWDRSVAVVNLPGIFFVFANSFTYYSWGTCINVMQCTVVWLSVFSTKALRMRVWSLEMLRTPCFSAVKQRDSGNGDCFVCL